MVVKSNLLVEASYKLTAQEQWVILTLTSKIRNDDEDFKSYSITVKEFAEMAGIRHKGEYGEVKEITKKLIGRAFTIYEPSGPLQLAWISSAKYHEGKGTVTLRFDPGLKPYLLQLKECFTKYSLYLVLRLKSSFSIRIYEFLKQYEKLGERTFLIEDLKEKLGILEDQYKLYGHFKAKVLKVAQDELAEKTDICFEYEEIKIGRGVGKLRFIIKSQVPQQTPEQLIFPESMVIPINAEKPKDPQLLKLFESVPQPFRDKESLKSIIQGAFIKHGFDYVLRNIVYANEKSNAVKLGSNLEKGSNYRNYLAKALKGDFGLPHKEDQEIKEKAAEVARRKTQEEATARKQKLEQTQNEKENHERARVFQQSLSMEALLHLREEALSRLDPKHQEMVTKKAVGSDLMLKVMMDKITLERMKLG